MDLVEELQARIARLEAHVAAVETAISALIRTAPDPRATHLSLTMAFEAAAGSKQMWFRELRNEQVETARALVEHWGTIATRFPSPFGSPRPAGPEEQAPD